MPASKDIVMRYFVQEADNLWKCSCGKVLSQKKNTGFTNLFNHIKSQHPEYASSGSQPSSPFISKPEIMSDQSIIDVIPTARENSQMIFLNQNLKKLDSVTLALQNESTDIADVRFLFDEVIKEFPGLESHCGTRSDIVHSPDFEAAIIKIINDSENELSDNEKEAAILLKNFLKKRKIEKAGSQYMNVKFILPTSNLVERFFSSATYSFGDLRQSLLPMNLEMQLFLKINQRFWNEQIVASIVA